MRRRLELTIGVLLLLSMLAGIPASWKINTAIVLSVPLIIAGIIRVRRREEAVPGKDATFVENHGPSAGEIPRN